LGDVEIGERKGELIVGSGKGGKDRVVHVNLYARRALSSCLEVRPQVADDRLFVGQRSTELVPRAVEELVEKYARLTDLPAVSPQTRRHKFGMHALDAGVDLVTVSWLMGHERQESTAIVTTPSAMDLENTVANLEAEYPSGHKIR
jgi:integrase/recombinase XerC